MSRKKRTKLAADIVNEMFRQVEERRTADQSAALPDAEKQARDQAGRAAKKAGHMYSEGVNLWLAGVPPWQIEAALRLQSSEKSKRN